MLEVVTHSPCPPLVGAGRSVCRRITSVWRWSVHCTPSSRRRSWQSFVWRDSPLSEWHHLKLSLYYLCFVSLIKMLQYSWNIALLNFLFSVINYKNCGSNIEKRVITSVKEQIKLRTSSLYYCSVFFITSRA